MGMDVSARSVLVVEADKTTRTSVASRLRYAGYTVSEAPDGELALRRLYTSQQQLVVLVALWMPGMDGMALLRAVAPRTVLTSRHAYVLMLSSTRTLPADFTALLMQLRVAVLAKPFTADALLTTVAHAAARLDR
jgi:CheY-like chemotaxis protein